MNKQVANFPGICSRYLTINNFTCYLRCLGFDLFCNLFPLFALIIIRFISNVEIKKLKHFNFFLFLVA